MVIGGGTITGKILFAVLLIFGLSLVGIAGASASDVGTTKVQSDNHSNVQKNNKTLVNDLKNLKNSTKKQNNTVKKLKIDKKVNSENQLKTPNKNTTNKKTQSIRNIKNSVKTHKVVHEKINALKHDVTVNSTKTTDVKNLQAAAGESKNVKNTSGKTEKPVAAKSSSTVTSKSFTVSQINDASARVNAYIKTKHKLPNYVTIGKTQVKMPAFLKLLTADIIQLNSGKRTPITLKNVKTPSKTAENFKSGKINKSSYLGLAKRVNAFINEKGTLPKQTTSSLGKMNYKSLIYTFSKISAFYKTNKRLPGYVSVKAESSSETTGTSTVKVPASLKKYVKATKNCQVNNSKIRALAKKITKGKKTTYSKAVAIFKWVRDHIGYSFYYNTRKGAVGTLNAKKGNCVDTAHLLIALSRATGIPARYVHGKAKFKSGKWYGHVWAGVYVNGKWYKADATSSKNSFGVIKNWSRATIKGKYVSLPF